jgi:hypothetical protein
MSYEASQSSVIPATRNALAPRGGLAFDGTAGGKGIAALTNQSIGTDAFSVSLVFSAPAYTGTTKMLARLSGVSNGSGGAGSALTIYVDTSLTFHFRNAAHDGYIQASVDFTPYYGKTVHVVGVRSGATFAIYVNGTSIAFTAPSQGAPVLFSQNLVTTYFEIGGYITTSVPISAIYSASLYNLALSQADVTEIYELGGAVPERFKFGTQANVYTSDWSAGTDGWSGDGTETGNNDGVTDGVTSHNDVLKTVYGAASISRIFGGASHVLGKAYRVSGKVYLPTANVNIVGVYANLEVASGSNPIAAFPSSTSSPLHNIKGTWRSFSGEYVANFTSSLIWWGMNNGGGYSNAALNDEVNFKDYVIRRIGAVCHYDADADGIGYQLHDQSTNKLDAVLTTTGVSWTKPARRGYVRGTLTWVGTHELKSLLGQRCIPNEARWDAISAKATVGSSGSGIRFADASDTYSIATVSAFTTAKKPITIIAANVFPGGTSDNNCNLSVDPDTANFTGSIQVDAQYSVTEGTP